MKKANHKKRSNVYRLISLYKALEKALEYCNKIKNNGGVPLASEWETSLIEKMKEVREVHTTLLK